MRRVIKKYSAYFGLIVLTFIVKEFYPFSFYPMYNQFPNYAYVFYILDENNHKIDRFMVVDHEELSHLFFSVCEQQSIKYGEGIESAEELEKVGEEVIRQALSWEDLSKSTIKKAKLYRIYNHLNYKEIQSDTALIATTYVE